MRVAADAEFKAPVEEYERSSFLRRTIPSHVKAPFIVVHSVLHLEATVLQKFTNRIFLVIANHL